MLPIARGAAVMLFHRVALIAVVVVLERLAAALRAVQPSVAVRTPVGIRFKPHDSLPCRSAVRAGRSADYGLSLKAGLAANALALPAPKFGHDVSHRSMFLNCAKIPYSVQEMHGWT
jgi:hypothetical protein